MSNELTKSERREVPEQWTPRQVIEQVTAIQKLMAEGMHEGEHFGTIPGTGEKKTLLKSGAEKLCLMFRLAPTYVHQRERDGGHLTVESICTLTHIPSGQVFATGSGMCSTYESRYAWRNALRSCPTCKKVNTIIKGQAKYGGGWVCYSKLGGCGATFKDGDPAIENQAVGRVPNENLPDTWNCVTPDTKILTHDLRWVEAGQIQSGDMLIGVEEDMDTPYSRCLAIGEATVYGVKEDLLYEISFADGRKVRCNGEHRWLVRKIGPSGTEWVSTEEIYREMMGEGRRGRPRNWLGMSLCAPWTEDTSREAGYLAGLLDADGCLAIGQSNGLQLAFAQHANSVLTRMEAGLESRGFIYRKSKALTEEDLRHRESQKQVFQLVIGGGLTEQMRLLGSIRPPRLLERWLGWTNFSKRRFESRGSGSGAPVRITGVRQVGTGDIVLLGTSCRTYIAEGFIAHNTVLKMADKRALVAAVLNATAASDIFTQDLEDLQNRFGIDEVDPDLEAPSPAPERETRRNEGVKAVFTAGKSPLRKAAERPAAKAPAVETSARTVESAEPSGGFTADSADFRMDGPAASSYGGQHQGADGPTDFGSMAGAQTAMEPTFEGNPEDIIDEATAAWLSRSCAETRTYENLLLKQLGQQRKPPARIESLKELTYAEAKWAKNLLDKRRRAV